MLYVVECAYTDPQSEAAWNTFYNREKLPALVSVPGFHASQRFCAFSEGCPRYLALHDIRDAAVLDSDAYRRNGGGHFARWQSAIADWHRHLYLTTHALREVAPDEVLLLSDTAEALPVAAPIVLQPGGLATRHTRYAAIVSRDDLHHRVTSAAVFIYQPITARLRHPAEQA
ncbi:TPA: hypothetical protein MYK64_004034 [Klebsiella quasipneumoniae subsp. similipneumoniae]|uniref:hypothetical protein n=1 Tax=Klebsiella quasipneumoniae TaxID=1463165 RepID=UPI0015E4F867|nr:hypothetical protein [Klebsiella quasipneumoniae]QLP58003.1 hypothetical protein HV092_11245 [Klebsiella quasipneumoniae]HCA9781343.1 hypothetical protein [Klebsiella quasipneumoniae subsp. similipneumoniae]HCI6773879.1 hypothetical protein [Klebsiella quasipneumoniae subsp. similipneumoniae]